MVMSLIASACAAIIAAIDAYVRKWGFALAFALIAASFALMAAL